jgi:hypothetical protein
LWNEERVFQAICFPVLIYSIHSFETLVDLELKSTTDTTGDENHTILIGFKDKHVTSSYYSNPTYTSTTLASGAFFITDFTPDSAPPFEEYP